MNEYWCIPPKENAEFVAVMDDILDIYESPYNPSLPVVCMDEKPYQCLSEIREPLPMRSGDIQKTDSEYVREGTCSIFVFTEPLRGWGINRMGEYEKRGLWKSIVAVYHATSLYKTTLTLSQI